MCRGVERMEEERVVARRFWVRTALDERKVVFFEPVVWAAWRAAVRECRLGRVQAAEVREMSERREVAWVCMVFGLSVGDAFFGQGMD